MSRSWFALALLAGACSGGTASEKADGDADTDGDADADADTDTDTDTYATGDSGTGPAGTGGLSGTVTRAGDPAGGRDLRFCRGTQCRYGETAADGSYAFASIPAEWHSLELVGDADTMTVFVPLPFADGEQKVADLALQPATVTALPRSAGPLLVAPGLELTVGVGDVAPGFGDPPTTLTGARVPDAERPPIEGIPGTVLAVWYVGPFDNAAVDEAGVPARFDTGSLESGGPLAEGTALRVYAGSYADSAWLDLGTVEVGADGWTDAAGLPVLSTVLLVGE